MTGKLFINFAISSAPEGLLHTSKDNNQITLLPIYSLAPTFKD